MALTRPSSGYSNKINVNPSISRNQEATAEDYIENSFILNEIIDFLEQHSNISNTKYYGTFSSLQLLVAAHPTADPDGYAIIDSNSGNPAQLAVWNDTNQAWDLKVSKELILIFNSQNDKPTTGIPGVLYLFRQERSIGIFDGGQYVYYGGIGFTINGSGPDANNNFLIRQNDFKIQLQDPSEDGEPFKKLIQSGGFSVNFHKTAFSGKIYELDTTIPSGQKLAISVLRSGNKSTEYNFDSGFFSIKDLDRYSILSLFIGGIAVTASNGVLNIGADNLVSSQAYGNYTDNSIITKRWRELAAEHNSFGTIRYINTSTDIEDALNASSGNYFLVKKNSSHYIAVRKSSNFDAQNCDFAIAGDPMISRSVLRITDPVLNQTDSTASYNLYDIYTFIDAALPQGVDIEFTFWRKNLNAAAPQQLSLDSNILTLENGGSADLTPYLNTPQQLSFANDVLSLENGGTADLSYLLDDTDDQTITNLSLNGNTITVTISGGNTATLNVSDLFDNTDSQALTKLNDIVTLQNGGSIDLAEYRNTDEQTITTFSVNPGGTVTLTISNGNTVTLDASLFFDNTDSQTLSKVNHIVTLQDGGSIDLTEYINTDNQQLSFVNGLLSITGGNSISLPFSPVENTFNASFQDFGGGATYTIGNNNCSYIKVGNLVTVSFDLSNINTVGTPTGALGIRNFPFVHNTPVGFPISNMKGATTTSSIVVNSVLAVNDFVNGDVFFIRAVSGGLTIDSGLADLPITFTNGTIKFIATLIVNNI